MIFISVAVINLIILLLFNNIVFKINDNYKIESFSLIVLIYFIGMGISLFISNNLFILIVCFITYFISFYITSQKHWIACLLSISILLPDVMLFINSFEYKNTLKSNIVYKILELITFLLIYLLLQYYLKKQNNKIENQGQKINSSYYRILETQNAELNQLLHDTKNHYSTILALDNVVEIKEYVKNISDVLTNIQIIKYTNNKVLDILLSKYKTECEKMKINLTVETKTANLNYLNDTTLTVLISNLMDNAIKSATNSDDREISFVINKHNDLDILTISNSCDELYKYNSYMPSSKNDDINHGFGINIIKYYTNKINADYNWNYNNMTKRFISTIVFHK